MLPTQGLFKDIECPYNENTCGRPYCHFRHKKRIRSSQEEEEEDDVNGAVVNEVPTYNPTPKSQLANVRNHIPITYVPDVIVRSKRSNRLLSYNNRPTYNPTPLSLLSSGKKLEEISEQPSDDAVEEAINGNDNAAYCSVLTDVDECKPKEKVTVKVKEADGHTSNKRHRVEKKKRKESDSERKSGKDSSSSRHDKSSSKSKHKAKDRDKDKSDSDKSKNHRHSSKSGKSSSKSSSSSKHKSHRSSSDGKRSSKSSSSKDKHRDNNEKSNSKDGEKKTDNGNEPTYVPTKKSELAQPVADDYFDAEMFDDEEDEFDVEQECLKIFQEYQPENKDGIMEKKSVANAEDEIEPYIPTSKKRVAYQNAKQMAPKLAHEKPLNVPNPAQVLTNRLKIARLAQSSNEQKNLMAEIQRQQQTKRKAEPVAVVHKIKPSTSTTNSSSPGKTSRPKPTEAVSLIDSILTAKTPTVYKPGHAVDQNKRRKINPVANMANMLKEKAKMREEVAKQKQANSTFKTPSQTIGKGTKRTAHVPDLSLAELPDVLHFDKSKLPVNVRTRFLTMLADETVKLYICRDDAYQRALNEEFKVYERCSALMTYKNSIMLTVNRIRKELNERETSGAGPYEPGDGNGRDDAAKESPFRGKRFYDNVRKYLLNEEDLVENGYPREGPVPGRALIKLNRRTPKLNLEANRRECARCSRVYVVDDRGLPVYEEECVYHPLRKRTFRGESWYLCCKSAADTGCTTSHTHVSDDLYEDETSLDGFQTTMASDRADDPRNHAVYALDCEMCYTTKGLELTRVTIVDPDCKTVYESLVKPLNPIVDYNTRFSGITAEQMDRTSTSILQVQANILHLCNSETILIGHSLESDMKALKIVHGKIIDTAILFPHKFGLPHKRALKTLASEYLMKIIQNDVNGHDSAEDAITCMELIVYKVKEELKTR